MEVIPAIDLLNGKCVRLKQGDYTQQSTYSDDPLAMAKYFESKGFRSLHLVDLDGARNVDSSHLNILEQIAQKTQLEIDFGGGIRSEEKLRQVFDYGATKVTAGSIAIKDPDEVKSWLQRFGADSIVIGADAKDGFLRANGWQEETTVALLDFIADFAKAGARHFICTDISKDGMMKGPSIALYKEIQVLFPQIDLVASGGVSKPSDLQMLSAIGVEKAIVGKALYEKTISIEEWLL